MSKRVTHNELSRSIMAQWPKLQARLAALEAVAVAARAVSKSSGFDDVFYVDREVAMQLEQALHALDKEEK